MEFQRHSEARFLLGEWQCFNQLPASGASCTVPRDGGNHHPGDVSNTMVALFMLLNEWFHYGGLSKAIPSGAVLQRAVFVRE